jgi:hypothetical protein
LLRERREQVNFMERRKRRAQLRLMVLKSRLRLIQKIRESGLADVEARLEEKMNRQIRGM